jgi:hypothetical protein
MMSVGVDNGKGVIHDLSPTRLERLERFERLEQLNADQSCSP